MSVVVKSGNKHFLVSKGAPEAIQKMVINVPRQFDSIVNEYAKQGFRVLGLGLKEITEEEASKTREHLE